MKWSRGHKQIFDGGALGRDAVDVYRADHVDDPRFRVFAFEDAAGPAAVALEAPRTPSAPPSPAAACGAAPAAPATDPGVPGQDAERREQEAYERGRQEGAAAARSELDRLAGQLEGAVQFFHDTMQKVDERASRQAVELALMVAEQLFRKAVEVDADRLLASVADLVDSAEEDGAIRIVVDPATAKQWRANEASLRELLGDRAFEVQAKPDLTLGDIIVHCGPQTLDERVAHRVRQYARAIEHELGLSTGG